jgi:hypothetical protein
MALRQCSECRKVIRDRSRLSPEWATGPEWQGWKFNKRNQTMMRWTPLRIMEIDEDGELQALLYSDEDYNVPTIACITPAVGLQIANILAEADGGWDDTSDGEGE